MCVFALFSKVSRVLQGGKSSLFSGHLRFFFLPKKRGLEGQGIFLEAPRGPVQLKPGLRPTNGQLKRAPVRGTEGPVRGAEGPVTGTGPLLIA